MLAKLFDLLPAQPGATKDTVGTPFQQRQIAVAVLLLELAQADRRVPAREHGAIEAVLRQRFGLDAATASLLLDTAQKILAASLEDWVFARMVRHGFAASERVAIFSLLWEVVYADGELAALERAAIEHLARELDITPAESEAARAQALARIGRSDATASKAGAA